MSQQDPSQPLQYKDLAPRGRRVVNQQMADLGASRTQALASRLEALGNGRGLSRKQQVERETLESIQPHVTDGRITTTSAANNRVKLYRRAQGEAHSRDETVPTGAGWYFHHHASIASAAQANGFDTGRAIDASATMSPHNNPDAEKAAVTALMHAHSVGKVNYTPQVHAALTAAGVKSDPGHVGRTVSGADLHPETLAGMSDAGLRHVVQPETDIDLKAVSKGGIKGNIAKAVRVLRGQTSFEQELDPLTGPKVTSYRGNIRAAVPNTSEHVEYMSRVEHDQAVRSGRQHPAQDMLDLYGKRHSSEGLLNPEGHTAEDTWMNSISHGLPLHTVPGTRTSIGKTVGSNQSVGTIGGKTANINGKKVSASSDPAVGGTALQHAFNNKATHVAAAHQSRGHNFSLPAVAMQEVSWAQARQDANKDPEFAAQQKGRNAEFKRAHAEAQRLNGETPGQQGLF